MHWYSLAGTPSRKTRALSKHAQQTLLQHVFAQNLTISRAVPSDSCRINSLCAWTLKKRHSPGLRFFAALVVQEPCLPEGTKLPMRHVESLVPIPLFHEISVSLVLLIRSDSGPVHLLLLLLWLRRESASCTESGPPQHQLSCVSAVTLLDAQHKRRGSGLLSQTHFLAHTCKRLSASCRIWTTAASTLSCVSTVTERIDSRRRLHEPLFLHIRKAHGCQNLPSVLWQ